MLALILGTQACLVSSAVLVAVGHPSVAVAVGAVVVTDAFVVSAVTTMVSLLGRGQ
jgi:hypothetical protein